MSGDVVIGLVTFRARAGREAEVRAVLAPIVERIQRERGCLLYALHESDDGRLMLVGRWATPEDARRHATESPEQATLAERMSPLLEAPPTIEQWRGVPIGDPRVGTLGAVPAS